jgi:hypothetical protein
MSKILLGLSVILASSPAWAIGVPGPEIGAGIPTLALIGGAALIVGAGVFLKRLRQ